MLAESCIYTGVCLKYGRDVTHDLLVLFLKLIIDIFWLFFVLHSFDDLLFDFDLLHFVRGKLVLVYVSSFVQTVNGFLFLQTDDVKLAVVTLFNLIPVRSENVTMKFHYFVPLPLTDEIACAIHFGKVQEPRILVEGATVFPDSFAV